MSLQKFTDLSWLQNSEDFLHNFKNVLLLLNVGLYILTIFPVWEFLNSVNLNSVSISEQWQESILLIIAFVFILAIRGVLHQISYFIRRKILCQISLSIEFIFFRPIAKFLGIEIENKAKEYRREPDIVRSVYVEEYLINKEHPKIQKIYDDRQEVIRDNLLSKLYAVEIVLLLLIQLKFNAVFLNEIAQQFDFPIVKVIQILCIVLVFYASRSYPDSWNFIYLPNNPIKKD